MERDRVEELKGRSMQYGMFPTWKQVTKRGQGEAPQVQTRMRDPQGLGPHHLRTHQEDINVDGTGARSTIRGAGTTEDRFDGQAGRHQPFRPQG